MTWTEKQLNADQPLKSRHRDETPTLLRESGSGEVFDLVGVIERYEAALLRYAARLLEPGAPELEDVVQEAFIRLHRQVTRFGEDSIDSLSTWLYRVTHNLARDVGRRRARRARRDAAHREEQVHGAVGNDEAGPTEMLLRREAIESALAALDDLPEPFRETIVLKILHGLTLKEIGEIMQTSIPNVSYRLNQGLSRLAERLRHEEMI